MTSGVPSPPQFTLTELRYALAVASTGHFGRAARACAVSQPTLSAGIKKLEESLGLKIFERSNKRVELTEAGARFLEQGRRVFDEVDRLGELQGEAAPLSGRLRLGLIPTLSPYLLPWLLPPLHEAHPELDLVIHEDFTHKLLILLTEHHIEMALLALPVDAGGIESLPLFDEPFLVLCPAAHRLARKKKITQRDLSNESLLLLTEGHCLRDQALEVCQMEAASVTGVGDFRATSLETLRQLVGAGMGVTLLPALAADSAPDCSAVIRPFTRPTPSRRIALVYRRGYAREESARALAAFIRDHLPESVLPID